MIYMHESNLTNKIATNYKGLKKELSDFKLNKYYVLRDEIHGLTFSHSNKSAFTTATGLFNKYLDELERFSQKYNVMSQSKFSSSFYEEISCYLFKDLAEIRDGTFGIFNKGIYAGLKIDTDRRVAILTKDVDFCIGKEALFSIEKSHAVNIILPVICVEVKTYLDATMFGEVKSSSRAIKSASPNSKTYVLMGYKDLKDEHIIAARQDSVLNEMFALKADKNSQIDENAVYDYWLEITNAIDDVTSENIITTPGRMLQAQ